jgi:hypothetical protein
MPNSDAIERLVREEVLAWQAGRPGKEVKSDKDSFTALLNQLAGLSESDIRRLLRELLGANGELSSDDVAALGQT